jgi:tRNA nucleotidyltransferase (CCA-adding enzyme)
MTAPAEFARSLFPARLHDRVFLVGGVVRDLVLGVDSEDLDLLVALPAETLREAGFRYVAPKSGEPVFFRHIPPFGKVEVTTVASPDAIGADLRRRDFTANAMAMDLFGTLIDPLRGKPDAESRLLRACSPASFLDDPVRVFRAFRFEADGWRMAAETEALLRTSLDTVPDAFADTPPERLGREMLKALAAPDPARFFLRMVECSAGASWLPELFRMREVPAGPVRHHPEGDLFTHSIQVLQRISVRSPDPTARFCALFHDLGKLDTDPALHPKHHGHEEAGFEKASRFCDRLRLPAALRRALAWTCRHHGNGHRWDALRDATRVTVAMQAIAAGIEEILPMVCEADRGGVRTLHGWADAVRVARMTVDALGIDRARLEAVEPSDRSSFILQKRVEALRAACPPDAPPE